MDSNRDNIAAKIESFIVDEFQVPGDDPRFTREVHLFEEGYMSSMGFVQLLTFLETAYNVKMDEAQMFGDEFTTINGIARLVEASMAAAA